MDRDFPYPNGTADGSRIEELEQKLRSALDDVAHARRRAQADLDFAHKYAFEAFAREVICVKDALETALHVQTSDAPALKTGLELCSRRLAAALERKTW